VRRPPLTGKIRSDSLGAGHFGAPRGSRIHLGTDYEVIPNDPVFAPMMGLLVRRGFVYQGRFDYCLCEIREAGILVRLMYMIPFPSFVGQQIKPGDIIGYAQDITAKSPTYKGMLAHIHMDVRIDGVHKDPETLMNGSK
jgi:hypothetical protein